MIVRNETSRVVGNGTRTKRNETSARTQKKGGAGSAFCHVGSKPATTTGLARFWVLSGYRCEHWKGIFRVSSSVGDKAGDPRIGAVGAKGEACAQRRKLRLSVGRACGASRLEFARKGFSGVPATWWESSGRRRNFNVELVEGKWGFVDVPTPALVVPRTRAVRTGFRGRRLRRAEAVPPSPPLPPGAPSCAQHQTQGRVVSWIIRKPG